MVIVNDQKFACQSCIKGHRSSACDHTDRPLFEIRKKGRPATQCDDCRDLRRLRRLHVRCACEGRKDPESEIGPVQIQPPTNGNRFGRKIPLVPKLPNGVRDIKTIGLNMAKTPSQSTSLENADDLHIEDKNPLPDSPSPFLGLEFMLPETPVELPTSPKPSSSKLSHIPHGMDCLCGPGCLCLGCTKHQRNPDADTHTTESGNCPPDCPSCIDNQSGAAWPGSLSSHPKPGVFAPLPAQKLVTSSSSWFAPSSTSHNYELDLDAEGEYDDELDAEGSPDPEFCNLLEYAEIPPPAKAGKTATRGCCAGKRRSSITSNGITNGVFMDHVMQL